MAKLDWFPIKESHGTAIIGAACFQGDSLIAVTAFFEDKDGDHSGDVGWVEKFNPFGMNGAAVAECFTGMVSDPNLYMKDPNAVRAGWGKAFVSLATGLIADGIYMVYFNRAVGSLAGAAAGKIASNPVKSFVIKKGMESVIKAAYRGGTR